MTRLHDQLGRIACGNEPAATGAELGRRAWVEKSPAPYPAAIGRHEAPCGHALLGCFLPRLAGAFGLRPLWEMPARILDIAARLLTQRGFVRGFAVGVSVAAPAWWGLYRLTCLCGGL